MSSGQLDGSFWADTAIPLLSNRLKKLNDEWIEEYKLEKGNFDIKDVDLELVDEIPLETQLGKVYTQCIL